MFDPVLLAISAVVFGTSFRILSRSPQSGARSSSAPVQSRQCDDSPIVTVTTTPRALDLDLARLGAMPGIESRSWEVWICAMGPASRRADLARHARTVNIFTVPFKQSIFWGCGPSLSVVATPAPSLLCFLFGPVLVPLHLPGCLMTNERVRTTKELQTQVSPRAALVPSQCQHCHPSDDSTRPITQAHRLFNSAKEEKVLL